MPKELQVKQANWENLDKRKFFVLQPTLSMSVRLLTYPATVVKTRLQTSGFKYNGTMHAFQSIIRGEDALSGIVELM